MKNNRLIKNLIIAIGLVTISLSYSSAADNIRITVSDFTMKSSNPEYQFLGKGFAEFVGVDLSKGKSVTLVEREKRRELLFEQELSMTGLIEENDQVKVGKMLAANYIVTGNIFDLAGQITVTYKILETETGKIKFQDKISGSITEYDFISASIAKRILDSFELKTPKSVDQKIQNKTEKKEEAVITFSKAIDAYDRNDRKTAKNQLDKAEELDPESEAVRIYLDKLIVNTAKFKTLSERYFPNTNPSYLGLINYDSLSFTFSMGPLNTFPDPNNAFQETKNGQTEYYEEDGFGRLSYFFPISQNLGFGIEGFSGVSSNRIRINPDTIPNGNSQSLENALRNLYSGGIFSAGIAISEYFSIGGSFSVYNHESEYLYKTLETKLVKAGTAGFLIKNKNSTLIFDTIGGYSTEEDYLINTTTSGGPPDYRYPIGKKTKVPKYNENTFTIAFFDKELFFVTKQVNYFYPDNGNYVGRLIPAIEFWLVPSFSLRGGADLSFQKMFGKTDTGLGGTGGFTLRSLSWGLELDSNITYRKQPSRFLEGETFEQFMAVITITKRNLFLSR